ncbi:crocetin glucosyltransferase 3-like isoform X2 [Magnolia sinica]|uniref:crocetin glucosyltransferase 3-like isoform X2 n=1 Tax=Magnolia sinica TaxID=86752 RepID=UPI0026591634|nr:crocetin glucosyltransferase 3-like isoform X2 [Magnolia sinica]
MAPPKSPSSPHIVMFPFMAQGHIIPFLTLAKLLDDRTPYTITFVSTPLNIKNLQSSLPPDTSIRLTSLPFNPSDHGLPSNAENTNSIPFHLFIHLCQATQTLQPSFYHLLTSISQQDCGPPLCIIGDIFLGWTVDVARQFDIFHVAFSSCGAYSMAAYFSLWLHLPHAKTRLETFQLPGFPETFRLHRSQLASYLREADGSDPWSVYIQKQISLSLHSNGMLCNAIEEMETTGLEIFRRIIAGIPVWCVGPLIPPSFIDSSSSSSSHSLKLSLGRTGKEPGISIDSCTSWLNLHHPRSVLYISFGSQNTISIPQMMELALGLEASGKPFIWVIRPPIGFDVSEDFRVEWLPEGFEERITETKRGMLVKKWAPQVEILSHGSIGGFLSHCGWNSMVESLSQGVPLIGWPMAAEQFYNAKMMEEELEAVRVGEMIKAAMRGGEGVEKGSSVAAIDDFIKTALSKRGVVE